MSSKLMNVEQNPAMPPIPEALAIAFQLFQTDQWQAAEGAYRHVLAVEPENPTALRYLGEIAQRSGRHDLAIQLLGPLLNKQAPASDIYRLIGNAFNGLKMFAQACEFYQHAISLAPDSYEAYQGLGTTLRELGRLEESLAASRQVVALKADFPPGYNNLGITLQTMRRFDDAVAAYRQALVIDPMYAVAHNNLGNLFRAVGRKEESLSAYRRAIELRPNYPEAWCNLGNQLKDVGQIDEAAVALRQAISLRPDLAAAFSNLGNILKDQGKPEEAITCFRRAIELQPQLVVPHSNLLLTMHYQPDVTAAELAAAHAEFEHRFARPLAARIQPHPNERSPQRRLRIGYVSSDFRLHPVGMYMLPLLEAHNRAEFEIYGYVSVGRPDRYTELLRQHCDVWRDVLTNTDEQVAAMIRKDEIDILVDLSMHTAESRILVFAEKPAPIQATYLAYCSTTGLHTVDYRFTDFYFDPVGQDDSVYTEESYRLPETFWCYRPAGETPEVTPPPVVTNGRITLGCFNNFCKVSKRVLETWVEVLHAIPDSQLLLHADTGKLREEVHALFVQRGINAERVKFAGRVSMHEYFRQYSEVDIALDPFPFGGGTTTCDAMWMGVPVITMAGNIAVGRGGVSVLSNLGMTELIAADVKDYIRLAAELAGDLDRLKSIRSSLRPRMLTSPLMDAPRFARNVEIAYRQMWHRYCAQSPRDSLNG